MATLFETMDGIYRLNVAQQRWVVFNVRNAAAQAGHLPSLAAIHHADLQVEEAARLQAAYAVANGRRTDTRDAQALDREIDRLVNVVHTVLTAFADLGRTNPIGLEASDLLATAFPSGLGAHVNAPHTEQASLNLDLVKRLTSPEAAPFVARNGLDPLVVELAAASLRFRALIGADTDVTWDEVRAGVQLGQEAVLLAVMTIAACFRPHAPHDVELRDAILRPFREIMSTIGAEKRAERAEGIRNKAKKAAELALEGGDEEGAEDEPADDALADQDTATGEDGAEEESDPADAESDGNAAANARADESLAAK